MRKHFDGKSLERRVLKLQTQTYRENRKTSHENKLSQSLNGEMRFIRSPNEPHLKVK